jgi:hypothetical protein
MTKPSLVRWWIEAAKTLEVCAWKPDRKTGERLRWIATASRAFYGREWAPG